MSRLLLVVVLLAACGAQNERVYQLVHRRTLASEPLPADVMDKFRWVKQQTKSVVQASYVRQEQVIVEFVTSYLSHVTFPKSQHLRDKLPKNLGPLEDSITHLSRAVIPYEGDVIGVCALDLECRTRSIAARMDRMTSLLDAGVYVHAAYAAKFGVTLEDNQRFLSLHVALGRLRGRLLKKQLDRCRQVDHVVHQLHTMLRRYADRSADRIADTLDSYLSDRYDTKDFLVVWAGSRTAVSFGSGFLVATTLMRLHAAVYFGHRAAKKFKIPATTYTDDDLQMAALGRPHAQHMKLFANDVVTHGNYLHWVRQSVESQHKHVTSYVYCSAKVEQRGRVEPSGYLVADSTVNMEVLPSVKVAEPADNMALINGYGLALSVSSGGWTNSDWLEQRPYAGTDDQVWSLIIDRIWNLNELCVSPSLSAAHSYTYLVQVDCDWHLQHQGWRREGYLFIQQKSGQCLTAKKDDRWITLEPCSNQVGQQWYFSPDGSTREDF